MAHRARNVIVSTLCGLAWLISAQGACGAGAGQGSRVELFDHGLQVPIRQFTLPSGWRVNQHIATDTTDVWRFFSSYVLDFFGPHGEVSTALMPRAVYPAMGENWEQVWLQLFDERVGRFGDFQIGPTMESALAQALFPQSFAYRIPIYERGFTGTFQGIPVDGRLFATVGQTQTSLILYPSAVFAPRGRLPAAIDALARMAASQTDDPRYAQASQQLMANRMQQHRQMMQANQSWFAGHMASMRQASQMQTQSNQQFSASLKSTYTTDDQFTDYVRDTTTFLDPWSNQQVYQMGQHDYWFTDGLGNYIGSDNPLYEPSPLTGDWNRIEPLQP